jgi:hypothetical protein
MLSRLRLMLTGLFLSFALIACGDDAANTNEAADTAAPEMETAAEPASDTSVDTDMTEADLVAKYGEPDLTQERAIDDLTIVHHEWYTDEGIVSVQIHNGEVAYSQFTPKQ